MKTSKNAFTMIELIFVIVILGILATIAIPKLSATRTDAKATAKATSVMNGATEIASYAVSRGVTDSNFSVMSNSILNLINSGEATQNSNIVTIQSSLGQDCIDIKITVTAKDDILSVEFHNANGDVECTIIQSLINKADYPIRLRGMSVVY